MSASSRDDKIAPTAHYTAYVWHRLGFPNADLFVTPLGRSLFWGFRFAGEGLLTWAPFAPSMTQYLEYRHRAFESVVASEHPDLVVELGAGLSRRGVTWASRGVRYVEVDLPHMLSAKIAMLAERSDPSLRAAIQGRLEHAPLDILADDFARALKRILGDAERPVVMAEGVLTYFSQTERDRLTRSVREALGGRGAFVGELRARQHSTAAVTIKALRAGIRLVTRGRGSGGDMPSHEASQRSFLDAGFSSVRAIDPARWAHLADSPHPSRVWVCR